MFIIFDHAGSGLHMLIAGVAIILLGIMVALAVKAGAIAMACFFGAMLFQVFGYMVFIGVTAAVQAFRLLRNYR